MAGGWSKFGERYTRFTGALELMQDLGVAMDGEHSTLLLGGGNPGSIPDVQAIFKRRLAEIAASDESFERLDVVAIKSALHEGWHPFVLDVRKPHEADIVRLVRNSFLSSFLDEEPMEAYLRQVDYPRGIAAVWLGVAGAVALSLAVAAVIFVLGASLEGRVEEIFEGMALLLAVGVLGWMVVWMKHQARHIKGRLEAQVQDALHTGSGVALAGLAFVAVGREGLETALFLFAAGERCQEAAVFDEKEVADGAPGQMVGDIEHDCFPGPRGRGPAQEAEARPVADGLVPEQRVEGVGQLGADHNLDAPLKTGGVVFRWLGRDDQDRRLGCLGFRGAQQ